MIKSMKDPLPEDIGTQCAFAVSLAAQAAMNSPEKVKRSADAAVKYLSQSPSVIPVYLFLKVLVGHVPQYTSTEQYRTWFTSNEDKCYGIAQLPSIIGE